MPLPDVVVSPRTDPIYNAHGYLTKVPVGAIRPFIEEFSKPGDLVLDPFAGSGMTGVAAVMSGRRAELGDLAVLGKHIGTGFLTIVDGDLLAETGTAVVDDTKNKVGHLYRTKRKEDGQDVEWVRTIWSFVYECPACGNSMNFYHAVTTDPKGTIRHCPTCDGPFKKRDWKNVDDVPVSVVVKGLRGKQEEQPVSEHDIEKIALATKDDRQKEIPTLEIGSDREMYRRSALGKWGLTETRQFFSARNGLVLFELWKRINCVDNPEIRKKLLFAFTAILPRASRRYQWSAKRPLNAQNQTYYISPVHFEWNVFDLFLRKINAIKKAQNYLIEARGKQRGTLSWQYNTCSADAIEHIDDGAVDYVFTDPPFGSNIFYADMNLFQEAWLGEMTDHANEAVIQTGGKEKAIAAKRYEKLIAGAFKEAFRVLKPGGCMSVVFGNSRGTVWSMVQRALRESGFRPSPVHIALLDKGQRSVKGLASGREGVVTVDLVLTVQKPKSSDAKIQQTLPLPADRLSLVERAISKLPGDKARNPSYVYVGAVKEAIDLDLPVDGLHLSDVLVSLAEAGYSIDPKSGLLNAPVNGEDLRQRV